MATPDADRHQYIALLLRLGARAEEGRYRHVYCNRDLNQAAIEWIGFDMDYTLAVYKVEAFDTLCHRLSMTRLVERFGYPAEVADIAYDPSFAIRGLVIDRALGHVLKMDAHGHVDRGVHGFAELPHDDVEAYRKSPPVLSQHRYDVLDTLFHVPEAYVYSAMVDYLEGIGTHVDFEKLAVHVRYAVDSIHADGSLKSIVLADLPTYIKRDRRLGATLHRFRSAGKKLFLMTNSYIDYTDAVMAYLLENGPADYKDWMGYFDVVVTGAKKPDFFKLDTPFAILDKDGRVAGEEHTQLRRNVVYQHGNLREFTRMIGAEGDEILYVGDHLYGDILRSKRDSKWRTAMIIPELEQEVATIAAVKADLDAWERAEAELATVREAMLLETEVRFVMQHPDEVGFDAWTDQEREEWRHAAAETVRNSDRLARRARDLVADIRAHADRVDAHFHPRWGALMKAGNEHSIFGQQTERYACLYTSRVTNFLAYSPVQYHRAPRLHLPHELDP
ncbi:MAG: HAD-IG family 5'-nucleotidase [Myxococcales bacterium]|nr:HAD-IG family 5'-nucleotidase [Myxococcales bacterium]MCB9519599.1 HAD-IG family 5'-nucleotidase [Myxococcales bacterium]MCB9530674.1 HAD-IG family 5'-nucleotidase [Myxococcales bacterium]MCB9533595.1 HAD-IG family 5'-nucleotidase [Myxococcales bacterium]